MAISVVQTIVSNAKTLIAANLSGWSQLLYEHDLERNPNNKKTQRYGFIPKGAGSDTDVRTIGRTAFDHTFQLILMNTYRTQDTDANKSSTTNALIDKGHDLIKAMGSNRLGQLNVVPIDIDEPEYFDDESMNAVAIKINLSVKYRYSNT